MDECNCEKLPAYIGTKVVQAKHMNELEAMQYLGRQDDICKVESSGQTRDGYLVVYEDGYQSWSPKEVFERCYRPLTSNEARMI